MSILTLEEKREKIKEFRPIDDIFFEAHLKRARFNAASITVKDSNPGDTFDDVLDVYVVYISEFDIFKKGKTIYHLEKVLRETGTIVDDGLREIFVNTEIDDGTEIAELMKCFL